MLTFSYHVTVCASIFPIKKKKKLCGATLNVFLTIRDTIRKPHPGNISNDKRRNTVCVTVAFIFPINKESNLFFENFRSKLPRSYYRTKSLFRWNARFESVVGFPGSKYFLSSVESSTKRPLGSLPRRRIAGKPATNDAPQVFKLRTRIN